MLNYATEIRSCRGLAPESELVVAPAQLSPLGGLFGTTNQARVERSHLVDGNLVQETSTATDGGGSCQCPDGQSYLVSDRYDSCATLACDGGTALQRCGAEITDIEKRLRSGKKVRCASEVAAENSDHVIDLVGLAFEQAYPHGVETSAVLKTLLSSG